MMRFCDLEMGGEVWLYDRRLVIPVYTWRKLV
jgi:hypothetical protein